MREIGDGNMAKSRKTVDTDTEKVGVDWKRVKARTLSKENNALYKQYAAQFEEASALGTKLKEAVQKTWKDKHPDGIKDQMCSFNAIGGVLLYVMKDKPKPKQRAGKAFDEDMGDDVFGSP
jgi:hypothetical protein